MTQEKNYQKDSSLAELLRQAQEELRQFLKLFDSAELADKFPNKGQRLNSTSSIEPKRILRISMQVRRDFIKSTLDLHFAGSGKKIGIDEVFLNNVSEILSQN